MADHDPVDLGAELLEAMDEVLAFERGEIALPTRRVEAMPAARVKTIRKAVSTSTRDFERRFHISARTVEGWERGKNLDNTAAVFLQVIEQDPKAVEAALANVVNDDAYAEAREHA